MSTSRPIPQLDGSYWVIKARANRRGHADFSAKIFVNGEVTFSGIFDNARDAYLALDHYSRLERGVRAAQMWAKPLPTIEQYAEIFPSPDPSRDNDPQLTIIDDANENFGLQLYQACMAGKREFADEEVQHIIHNTHATMNDLHWSHAVRAMAMKQFNAAYHAYLGSRGYGHLTFNR